jgi:hypothetical protein
MMLKWRKHLHLVPHFSPSPSLSLPPYRLITGHDMSTGEGLPSSLQAAAVVSSTGVRLSREEILVSSFTHMYRYDILTRLLIVVD